MSKTQDESMAHWAEDEMTLPTDSKTALRGGAAAASGRALLERALGGRPPLDAGAPTGKHARNRQVRLPAELDARLVVAAARRGATPSVVLREALTAFLTEPPTVASKATPSKRERSRSGRRSTTTPLGNTISAVTVVTEVVANANGSWEVRSPGTGSVVKAYGSLNSARTRARKVLRDAGGGFIEIRNSDGHVTRSRVTPAQSAVHKHTTQDQL